MSVHKYVYIHTILNTQTLLLIFKNTCMPDGYCYALTNRLKRLSRGRLHGFFWFCPQYVCAVFEKCP